MINVQKYYQIYQKMHKYFIEHPQSSVNVNYIIMYTYMYIKCFKQVQRLYKSEKPLNKQQTGRNFMKLHKKFLND